ncbi:MAG: hypothetical protein ETSY2_41475 [Candidatus Entotheonella gemina]|uniref:Antitoxin n=1 Tax=Candidatus Entotheonella gemina TaxID=1429439 RepID=W4LMJ2_9BACT|nr:MAG: hypothetical protein ETSY2_41475 [Candidatus Entotheonella gemina]
MKNTRVEFAEAQRHFTALLGRIAYGGETITIMRRGMPMAKLVPLSPVEGEGRLHVADAQGWLEADDTFFASIDQIIVDRDTHIPRTLSPIGE